MRAEAKADFFDGLRRRGSVLPLHDSLLRSIGEDRIATANFRLGDGSVRLHRDTQPHHSTDLRDPQCIGVFGSDFHQHFAVYGAVLGENASRQAGTDEKQNRQSESGRDQRRSAGNGTPAIRPFRLHGFIQNKD